MSASPVPAGPVPMFLGGTWSESDQPIEVWTPGGERLVGTSYEATAAQLEQAPLMILGDIPTLLYSGSAINRLKLIPPNSSRGETPEQAARPGLPGDLAIFFEFNHCVAH